MKQEEIIASLSRWGDIIENGGEEQEHVVQQAFQYNPWFTPENIRSALTAISKQYLDKEKLEKWISMYPNFQKAPDPRKVGLIMAGNIPLVGFQDLLAVLITGNIALIKLSSKDQYLLPFLIRSLKETDLELASRIRIVDRMNDIDAIIATGSNNTSRYFEYYFAEYPHIIRRNRGSVAVITGDESDEEIQALGKDIFQYFGLGCRNISKIYFPKGYDIPSFMEKLATYEEVKNHNKYKNNFDYNLTILLMNRQPHFANEFLIMEEKEAVSSPGATVYYEYYNALEQVRQRIREQREDIQCIASKEVAFENSLPFGKAQSPQLWDYADDVDVVSFLLGLI